MIYILTYFSKAEYPNCKLICKIWDRLHHTVAVKRKEITNALIVDLTMAVMHVTVLLSQLSDYEQEIGTF